jgi:hypothetical protein
MLQSPSFDSGPSAVLPEARFDEASPAEIQVKGSRARGADSATAGLNRERMARGGRARGDGSQTSRAAMTVAAAAGQVARADGVGAGIDAASGAGVENSEGHGRVGTALGVEMSRRYRSSCSPPLYISL